MSKNIEHLQHIKSNVVIEGKPKLPTAEVLVDGELAVNYAEGYETISLRNSNSGITTFSSDDYYTKNKLGSGFTGVNSANTVTSVIEENEEIISSALNDLEERKLDASAYTPTDLSNYYTKSQTSGATELEEAFSGKADSDYVEEIELVTAAALNDLEGRKLDVSAYTPTDLTNYYTKSETSGATEISAALNGYADSVKYNSTARTVEFYHGTTGGTKVFEFDASAFIVDGMVDNVEVDDVVSGSSTIKCLVISFNTDAGKQDINIPISDIFNPDIYYTKDEIDNSELVISSALNDLESRKLDASAYTPTDLTNYYTKSQTSGATEISNALGAKASVSWVEDRLGSGFTSENSGITVTEAIEENEEIISAALNDLDSRKEDTVEIDSTAKASSFNASVGKYYFVSVPDNGSVTVTLPTPNMSSANVQNIIFLVTLGSGTASITFTPIAFKSEGFDNMAASSTYEVNALWNGNGWIMAMTKLEAV